MHASCKTSLQSGHWTHEGSLFLANDMSSKQIGHAWIVSSAFGRMSLRLSDTLLHVCPNTSGRYPERVRTIDLVYDFCFLSPCTQCAISMLVVTSSSLPLLVLVEVVHIVVGVLLQEAEVSEA